MKKRNLRDNSIVIDFGRWTAYATAGAASAFAFAPSAEAAIHYSGKINHWIGGKNEAHFPFDQPGDSFRIKHNSVFSSTNGYGGTAKVGINGLAGGAFAGFYNASGHPKVASVSNLARLQYVSTRPFLQRHIGTLAANTATLSGGYVGQFDEGEVGFIGFKFNNGAGDQYGWVRVRMGKDLDHTVQVIDYAYGDVGDPIQAGQTSSDSRPGMNSLGGLALGAAGVLAWRKRR